MAFNLPTPQNIHTSSSDTNRGDIGRTSDLSSTKSGGNLPISTNASQVINKTVSSANGNPAGVFFGMDGNSSTSTYDATQGARVFLWSLQYNAPNRIQSSDLANGGSRFWLGSGANPSSNYKEFFIGGNDTPFCASQAGPVTMCIDISDVSNDNTIGSFDPTQISAYGHGSVRLNLVGNSTLQTFFQRSFLFTTTKGSSNIPTFTGVSNFDDAIAVVQGDNYTNKIGSWLTKSGSSFFIPCPFSFGDGVNSVDFNDNGVSIVSPDSNSPNQENFRLTNDAMRVYYNPSGIALNNNCVLSGSYSFGTAAKWNFDVDAPHTLSGNFTGMGDISAGSGGVLNGNFNLASGSSVICNGANFDNINVQGDCKILGNSVTDFNGISIDGDLDFDTAGTYTLTNSIVGVATNSSGGAVIINNAGSTITTNTGPNITIVLPAKNISVTGIVAGSRIRVYNTTTSAQVVNEVVSGTSYTASYAEGVGYSVGDVLDLRATKIDKLEFSATVVVGSTGWNSLVSQSSNPVYASHGVNGATVLGISWDSGNLQFDFNDADNQIDGADIGAWYYYFITTEIGITEAFKALNWPQINKITNVTGNVSMAFDNTKSTPLRINNCWIDKDDGSSIIATASNSIQIDPPAVFIAKAESSGMTPEQAAELTAVKTKTDLLNFTGTDVKATLDGEEVVTDAASRDASKATETVSSNMRGTDGANTVEPTNQTLTIAQNAKLNSLDTDNLDEPVSTRATKADVDQALVDYNVDTKTNVKPSISV